MPDTLDLTFLQIRRYVQNLVSIINKSGTTQHAIYGIPRGGCVPATMLAENICWSEGLQRPEYVGLSLLEFHESSKATILVDDVIDSGRTIIEHLKACPLVTTVAVMVSKVTVAEFYEMCDREKVKRPVLLIGSMTSKRTWVRFPWESVETPAEDSVRRILQAIGQDPDREGLVGTPARFIKAMKELVSGYDTDPKEHLKVMFGDVCADGQVVALMGVDFSSLCEHHLLSFSGTVDLAYAPGSSGVVGLSKLARMVQGYANRLQVQERLTSQIYSALTEIDGCRGAYVRVRAKHSCMCSRGIKARGGVMLTEQWGGHRGDLLRSSVANQS